MMTGFKIDQRDKRKPTGNVAIPSGLAILWVVHYFGFQTKIFVKRYFFLLLVNIALKVF